MYSKRTRNYGSIGQDWLGNLGGASNSKSWQNHGYWKSYNFGRNQMKDLKNVLSGARIQSGEVWN